MDVSDNQTKESIHGSSSNIGFLLTRTASLWNELLMHELFKSGFRNLKPSHGSVLIPLFDTGEQSITSIMKFSKLKKQTMTTYVKELLKLNLIQQRKDPSDGRSKLISLTKLGNKLKTHSQSAVTTVNNRFLEMINKEEFKTLHSTLTKILSNLD